jgi:alpha-ketoglutarate-dependent taurine dioxygenase
MGKERHMSSVDFQTSTLAPTFGRIVEGDAAQLRSIDLDELIATFKRDGAVLLRGFQADVDDFRWLTSILCHDFSTYRGGGFRWGPLDRDAIGGDATLMTVTGSGQGWPIPLHGEMYYLQQRPTMLWFYCERAPSIDGQTTLCDAEAALAAISEPTREWLRGRNIKYIRELTRDEWPLTFQTDDPAELARVCEENGMRLTIRDDGSILAEFVCPAVVRPRGRDTEALLNNIVQMYTIEWAFTSGWVGQHLPQLPRDRSPMVVRMEDGTKVPSPVFEELQAVYEKLTVNVDWRTQDILLVDNTRLMHGRRQATDPNRSILVRMGEPAFPW